MRGTTDANSERGTMRISARNVLKGTITDVEIGAVSGVVSIKVGETALTSIITMEAIHDLGLKKGMPAYAVIKASHVMFARGDEPLNNLSARNQLVGTVTTVRPGKTDGRVSLTLADGNIITGRGLGAAIPFGLALVGHIAGSAESARIREGIVYIH